MKYILIKLIIGGVFCEIELSEQFILHFPYGHNTFRPIQIIDRFSDEVFRLDESTGKYEVDTSANEYSKGWIAEGKSETVEEIVEMADVDYGNILQITVKSKTSFGRYNREPLLIVHEFISFDNPILDGLGLINDSIDWRIFNNNHYQRKDEFPFKIRQYSVDSEGIKFMIHKIESIEEKTYSTKKWEFIKDITHSN